MASGRDSSYSSAFYQGLAAAAAIAVVGVSLYYLSKEDEFEEMKDDVKKLGKTMGGFSSMDMKAYIDQTQLCKMFAIIRQH